MPRARHAFMLQTGVNDFAPIVVSGMRFQRRLTYIDPSYHHCAGADATSRHKASEADTPSEILFIGMPLLFTASVVDHHEAAVRTINVGHFDTIVICLPGIVSTAMPRVVLSPEHELYHARCP